jgi:hypothetical protein
MFSSVLGSRHVARVCSAFIDVAPSLSRQRINWALTILPVESVQCLDLLLLFCLYAIDEQVSSK